MAATDNNIGRQLREARERKHMTMSEVAAATRSKVPIIEAIERDDFRVFAAPIYGKGFIRLYAQVVGIDPQPLVEAYMRASTGHKAPSIVAGDGAAMIDESPVAGGASRKPPAAVPAVAGGERARTADANFDLFNAEQGSAPTEAPTRAVPRPAISRTSAARALLAEVFIRWWQALRESLRLGRTSAAEITTKKDPWNAVPVVIGIVIVLIFVVSGLSKCASRREASGLRLPSGGRSGGLVLAVEAREPYFE